MIEPRAWQVSGDGIVPKDDQHSIIFHPQAAAIFRAQKGVTVEALTTVADVLAALRQPSETMVKAGWIDKEDVTPAEIFLAMLDQFEKEQQP